MRATVPAGGPVLIHKHFASTLRPPTLGEAILSRVIDTRDRRFLMEEIKLGFVGMYTYF